MAFKNNFPKLNIEQPKVHETSQTPIFTSMIFFLLIIFFTFYKLQITNNKNAKP